MENNYWIVQSITNKWYKNHWGTEDTNNSLQKSAILDINKEKVWYVMRGVTDRTDFWNNLSSNQYFKLKIFFLYWKFWIWSIGKTS